MKTKNKVLTTISLSALIGFLLGAIIAFLGVSNYLGKYTADIAARTAASQLSNDVTILQNLETGHQDKAIELIKLNIGQKYTYLNSLRHDASEFTRSEVKSAITHARDYLGDALVVKKDAN